MRFSRFLAAIAVLAGLSLGGPFSAQASTIDAKVVDLVAYGTVQMSLDSGSHWAGEYAGIISMKRIGGDSPLELEPDVTNFVTFCIEPREGIYLGGEYTWEVEDLAEGTTSMNGMGAAKADLIRELIGREYVTFGGPLTALRAAAIQIAIWEIVEENSATLSVTTGNVRYRNESIAGMLDLAQSMLSALDGLGPKAMNLYALTNEGSQDLLIQVGPVSVPNVEAPEPTSMALLGIGLLGLGVFRKKFRQDAR